MTVPEGQRSGDKAVADVSVRDDDSFGHSRAEHGFVFAKAFTVTRRGQPLPLQFIKESSGDMGGFE
jgi:hypothetical protein